MKDPLRRCKKYKAKAVKVVVLKIIAYISDSLGSELIPDWRCPNCGYGVADDYVACPHCGSELDWSRARKPSKAFKKFMERL